MPNWLQDLVWLLVVYGSAALLVLLFYLGLTLLVAWLAPLGDDD